MPHNMIFMKTEYTFPMYAKLALIILGLFAFVSILSVAQTIIVPLIYSTIIAILLSPVVNFLVRKNMNRMLAIILTVTVAILFSVSILLLLMNQLLLFKDSLPELLTRFHEFTDRIIYWISINSDFSTEEINIWFGQKNTDIIDGATSEMGQTLINAGNLVVFLLLIPIYVFLILFYRARLLLFIHQLFHTDSQGDVNDVIFSTKKIIQGYLTGLLWETLIIASLYCVTLMIIGVPYAILLAVVGAMINLIPYLGAIIAAALAMTVTLITLSPVSTLIVLGCYIFIQLVDNNIVIPRLVGSKVRINALVSIIAVIAGGALWGISGMFLAIPLTAILKVIFDHTDGLKPWGYLLGNTVKTIRKQRIVKTTEKS